MPIQNFFVRLARDFLPAQLRAQKSFLRLRIGNVLRLPSERGELMTSAFPHHLRKSCFPVIGEVEKRSGCTPFFALEQQRYEWRSQHERGSNFQLFRAH